jgi:hypothetical protein
MKIFSFIKWQWKRWNIGTKSLIFSMLVIIGSVIAPSPLDKYLLGAGLLITLTLQMKWFIWDSIKVSHKKFQEEQQHLFTIIKESDK